MKKIETTLKATENRISEIYSAIPSRINELLAVNGLGDATQAEQARYMGLTIAQYRAVMLNEHDITLSDMLGIADSLGTTIDYLLMGICDYDLQQRHAAIRQVSSILGPEIRLGDRSVLMELLSQYIMPLLTESQRNMIMEHALMMSD